MPGTNSQSCRPQFNQHQTILLSLAISSNFITSYLTHLQNGEKYITQGFITGIIKIVKVCNMIIKLVFCGFHWNDILLKLIPGITIYFLKWSDSVHQMFPFTMHKLFSNPLLTHRACFHLGLRLFYILSKCHPFAVTECCLLQVEFLKWRKGQVVFRTPSKLQWHWETSRRHLVTEVVTITSDKFTILLPLVAISMLNTDYSSILSWTVAVWGFLGGYMGICLCDSLVRRPK